MRGKEEERGRRLHLMVDRCKVGAVLRVLGVLGVLGGISEAKVYLTHPQALSLAFPPPVLVERRTMFLTPDQKQAIEKRMGAGAKIDSKLLTYYRGLKAGQVEAYAFFETHIVRTKPETYMVVVTPDGAVKFVELLVFEEPEDFLPPKKWREEFSGKRLEESLRVRRGISNIAGATLTSLGFTDGVRKVLACLPEVLAEEDSLRNKTKPASGGAR